MDVKVKAARAKAILEDDLFKEALSMLIDSQVGVFKYPTASEEDIMEAHRMVRCVSLLERQLQSYVTTGRLLERKQK
jgi:hypothetical protein